MATVTVTETGVALSVSLIRDGVGPDRVVYSATSLTDVPEVAGRFQRDVEMTLTSGQAAYVKTVLDFIETIVKDGWNIP